MKNIIFQIENQKLENIDFTSVISYSNTDRRGF